MAVSPINVSRVSLGMKSNFALDSLRRSQLDLFTTQARLATGRSFLRPSENPVAAGRAADLTQAFARQEQFLLNLQFADNALAAADSVINNEVNELLIQAQNIASQNVSNLISADERTAEAELIAGIRSQLQTIGNRQFGDRYLFAGRATLTAPFIDVFGGVAYVGDTGELVTRVDQDRLASFSLPGNVLFGALSSTVGGSVDLSPTLTDTARLEDLRGATGTGIQLGTLVFNESGGAGVFSVNLASADTIGDVVALINAAAVNAGASLTASVTGNGITLTPGGSPVSVTDAGGGSVAASLGILSGTARTAPIVGADLGARVTRLTAIASLAGDAGIDLGSGLIITNGDQSVTVDLSAAETVQDIINAINNAGLYVDARINDAGTGIVVVNQVSGAHFSIGENGGTTATDLGLRTLDLATPLDALNFGAGVSRIEGESDLQITASDGSTLDINLDGATTVGDVIDLINTEADAAGMALTASLAEFGNGIQLVDDTRGSGSFSVTALNDSPAALNLGMLATAEAGTAALIGEDINLTRTEGILDVLIELERALRDDDTGGITREGERLEILMEDVTRVHGEVGARSQAMQAGLVQMADAATTTQIFLSQVQDLDFAEAATQLVVAQVQYQANLQATSILLNLSLMDFLG